MATIARTTVRYMDSAGIRRRRIGTYTGPASYVTGGDSLTPAELNLGTVEFLDFENAVSATPAARLLVYDHTNQKVIWIVPNTGAEVANGVDLSGFSARFEAAGN